jgi:glycosyltransferase involved in cell wall biosynthesis
VVRGAVVVRQIAFAVPGDLNAPSGYAYDRRMIAELEQIGWHVEIPNLGEGFPWPSDETRTSAEALLLGVPNGDTIVIDGLAFGVLPSAGLNLRINHPVIALVHHPLALESGLSAQQIVTLRDSERAALAAATRVVVTSGATARCLAADYCVPKAHIVVAPPGVDQAPTARGNVDGVVQLLSVGAVVARKGYDVLVASLATLSELPWHLSIAGNLRADPEAAAALEKDIARFRLGARITSRRSATDPSCRTLCERRCIRARFTFRGLWHRVCRSYRSRIAGDRHDRRCDTGYRAGRRWYTCFTK